MSLIALGHWIEVAIAAWFAGLLAVVVLQVASGRIRLDGLIIDPATDELHVHRLQFLAVSTGFAIIYAASALHGSAKASLPDIPSVALGILVGSHGTYLAKKLMDAPRGGGKQQ